MKIPINNSEKMKLNYSTLERLDMVQLTLIMVQTNKFIIHKAKNHLIKTDHILTRVRARA